MQKGDILKKILNQSSVYTNNNFPELLSTVGDMALKRRAKKILEGLELSGNEQILEIGCGNGYYLSLLNRISIKNKLTGIDTDEVALKNGQRFINNDEVKLIKASAEKLPFKDFSFDRIIMSEVIEHVSDEKKSLDEAYRVLKKEGIFVLTTCNIDYPFFWDPVSWVLQHFFGTHIKSGFWAGIWNQHDRMYRKEQIENLVKNTGFNIERSEVLTSWCLPFNHYVVNFIAKLFYSNKLPKNLSKGLNKFQNNKQPILVRAIFYLINLWDSLNDLFPQRNGVSIFIKARKYE